MDAYSNFIVCSINKGKQKIRRNQWFIFWLRVTITKENSTGLDGKFRSIFCLLFMLRPIEKFIMCQYLFVTTKTVCKLPDKNGNTTAPELTALPIHFLLLLMLK